MEEAILQDLYLWVDKIPLSRVKKNISRDFADGVLMAEVMKYFFPKIVDVHNFPTCNSVDAKRKNWHLLNWKVFKKLNFELSDEVIDNLANAKSGTIEKVLLLLRSKIDNIVCDDKGRAYDYRPEADRCAGPRVKRERSKSPSVKNRMKKAGSFQTLPENYSPTSNILRGTHINGPEGITRNHPRSPGRHIRPPIPLEQNTSCSTITDSEFVPRSYYEAKLQDCLTLEETVEILHAKIKKLENLLSLKDRRIDELQKKLNWISK